MDYPHHVGSGVYELSDGERMKGKQAAIEAESALADEDRPTEANLDAIIEELATLELPEEAQELIGRIAEHFRSLLERVESLLTEADDKPYGAPSQAPRGYKGPICPKCGDYRVRQLSAAREAAECLEPTHRAKVGIKMLPALYVCPCGKRWEEVA